MHFERSWIVGLKDTPAALIIGAACDREEVKKNIVACPPLITSPLCSVHKDTGESS